MFRRTAPNSTMHPPAPVRPVPRVLFASVVIFAAIALGACGNVERAAETGKTPQVQMSPSSQAPGPSAATARTIALDTLDDFGAALSHREGDSIDASRVVSLNPAFTEIVYAIGAGGQLVGRTTWDNRPAAALAVTDVGAGIRPNVEAVLATRPTLVLMYATAENRAAADALARAGVRTIALRTVTIGDFRRAARVIGAALAQPDAAAALTDSIDATLARVREAVRDAARPRVVWPSWDAPVLVVGNASYEAELLDLAGADNVFADRDESVANVTIEEIAKRDPTLLLAGPERARAMRASAPWNAVRAVREGRVLVLDTAVVGRPGVTIGMAAVSIARLLHPERRDRLP